MRGLAVGIDAVHGDFHAVAPSLVDDGSISPVPGVNLDLASFSFQVPMNEWTFDACAMFKPRFRHSERTRRPRD
jgi:hypothetical protein